MRHSSFFLFLVGVLAIGTATSATRAEVLIGFAAPFTGPYAWSGAWMERGVEAAVADLNARGGVLGEQIEVVTTDDYCDGEQAVAAANALVARDVIAVFGHECSGAAIPASKVYADAGILMVSTFATSPELTEQGFTSVFRVVGRDDVQGRIAGDLLAERWGDTPIAILHDGQAYGRGLAEETERRLSEHGIAPVMFEAIEPGEADYWDVLQRMQMKGAKVLYFGGYQHEAGLIIRQAREHGYELRLVTGDGISNADFGLIAGPAADGTLMTYPPSPDGPVAAEFAARFTDEDVQPPFQPYAAVQAWAQAVEIAGSFATDAVTAAMRRNEFDTVLGRIGFDAKGDVTGYDTFVWYVWKNGTFAPANPRQLTE